MASGGLDPNFQAVLIQHDRSVYLATDDSTTVEATKLYPQVRWLIRQHTEVNRTVQTPEKWQVGILKQVGAVMLIDRSGRAAHR